MQRGEQQPPGNRLQLLQVVVGGCCWQFLTFQVKVVSRISALSCVKDAHFPEKFKQELLGVQLIRRAFGKL